MEYRRAVVRAPEGRSSRTGRPELGLAAGRPDGTGGRPGGTGGRPDGQPDLREITERRLPRGPDRY